MYRDLADFFAGLRCVCIRYDKRGTHQSSGDFQTSGLYELVYDAISVIRYAWFLWETDFGDNRDS